MGCLCSLYDITSNEPTASKGWPFFAKYRCRTSRICTSFTSGTGLPLALHGVQHTNPLTASPRTSEGVDLVDAALRDHPCIAGDISRLFLIPTTDCGHIRMTA
jgi:hypothetical protein